MKMIRQNVEGCVLIKNDVYDDERGLFFEVMNEEILNNLSVPKIDQVNISKSKYGVFRGFHYQVHNKLTQFVTCIRGEVLDFGVDLRKNSATFGNIVKANLSETNHDTLYFPPGIAHGFLSISKESVLLYHVHGSYVQEYERGLNFLSLDLDMPFKPEIINKRDSSWPNFDDCEYI
jgi:dTDP-4-dehydrorhamnose 3,5-epimerase|tara:strand:+ start:323 stop:850 length:528 start_codon:yes stop_codon:yes gene_type:complete